MTKKKLKRKKLHTSVRRRYARDFKTRIPYNDNSPGESNNDIYFDTFMVIFSTDVETSLSAPDSETYGRSSCTHGY